MIFRPSLTKLSIWLLHYFQTLWQFLKVSTHHSQQKLVGKLPNRKIGHISAYQCSSFMKLAESAYSNTLDIMTISFHGNYTFGLLGLHISASSYTLNIKFVVFGLLALTKQCPLRLFPKFKPSSIIKDWIPIRWFNINYLLWPREKILKKLFSITQKTPRIREKWKNWEQIPQDFSCRTFHFNGVI